MYSQNDNKRGRGTPKTARSVVPKQVVTEKVVELVEVESRKETSHPEKDTTDRSVEGDKQPNLARDPETSKKTLHHDESERGGQRSDSKKASRKKADKKSKGTGQNRERPSNPC